MSSKFVSVTAAMTPNVNAADTRQVAKFHPSIWGDYFINHVSEDKESIERKEQRIGELKEEVKRELIAIAAKPSHQLKFIDDIQRLGVGYLFQKEIEEALQHIFQRHCDYEKTNKDDLCNVALLFRLLRQQGYNISCDIFNKFKDDNGNFNELLIMDAVGMLELYEAAHFRKHAEDILDKAIDFTAIHLSQMEVKLSNSLAAQISYSLKHPILKDIPRLQARHYISIYEKVDSHNEALIELAKLDFNLIQSMHKKELKTIARWWKDMDVKTNLPYIRDRHVEAYFWMNGLYFEPQISLARCILSKIFLVGSIIDDTYDNYGTYEELLLFTTAIERWDISCIEELPTECMKLAYQTLLDLDKEINNELTKQGRRSYHTHYWKEATKMQVKWYFQEAKWLHQKYVPSMEEYMNTASPSAGFFFLAVSSFIGMNDEVAKEIYDYVFSFPKIISALSVIGRLLNDIVSHKFERKREHASSSIECYMKQYGVSEEEAYEELQKQIEDAWKDLNEACLDLEPSPIPRPLLKPLLNLARTTVIIYGEGTDEYSHVGESMKAKITSVLVEPVLV